MTETAISAIVALAKAGVECCRTAKVYKAEAARIGQRLTLVVARTHAWKDLYAKNASSSGRQHHHSLVQFHQAVENVFICMEAASSNDKSTIAKLKGTLGSKNLLESIQDAERQLNIVLNDLHMQQSNAIYARLDDLTNNVAVLLDQFAANNTVNSSSSTTIQEKVQEILQECKEKTPELVITNDDKNNVHNTTYDFFLGQESKVKLEAITLKPSQIIFRDNDKGSWLGGGGFADVFRGSFQGQPVAIKRLKVDARDFSVLHKQEIQHDVDALAREALIMAHCRTHPHILTLIGFVPTFDEVRRPLVVMELMDTTLFDAIHSRRSSQLSFVHLLFLLKGVAGALEFLHLQGMVHHDVKSVRIIRSRERERKV